MIIPRSVPLLLALEAATVCLTMAVFSALRDAAKAGPGPDKAGACPSPGMVVVVKVVFATCVVDGSGAFDGTVLPSLPSSMSMAWSVGITVQIRRPW